MKNHQKLVDVPFSPDQLKRIEDEIVREARRTLVGRRFGLGQVFAEHMVQV